MPGSYLAGALGGRYSKKLILAWIFAVRAVAIGLFIALPITPVSLYAFSAVFGLTWLGTVPLTNGLVGQIFGVKYLSTLFSISFLGHQLGAFAGAWAGGVLFDATGSYQLVWIITIALSVIACALCLPIDERALVRPALRPAP
jgi:MFS family permease